MEESNLIDLHLKLKLLEEYLQGEKDHSSKVRVAILEKLVHKEDQEIEKLYN